MFVRMGLVLVIVLLIIFVVRIARSTLLQKGYNTDQRYKEQSGYNRSTQTWKDYYQILQVHPTAEQEVIKAAYNRLAKKYHPDVNPEPSSLKRMKDLNEAFDVLGNLTNRRSYHQKWLQRRS